MSYPARNTDFGGSGVIVKHFYSEAD